MIDPVLQSRLRRAAWRQRILVLTGQLALCWLSAALLGLGMILVRLEWGWASMLTLPILGALAAGLSSLLVIRWAYRGVSERQTARAIEHRYPDLKGVLLTAVQQQIPQGGSATYLQQRVIDLAVGHSRERDWRDIVPRWRMMLVQAGHWAAFVGLLAVLRWELQLGRNGGALDGLPGGMVVTPGDAQIERGESLVVLARFGGALPPGVNLIVHTSGEAPRQIALVKSLADPVFGTSIPEVDHDLIYRLEYGEHQTRDYHITVFEHPRLEQANAQLTYPAYTKQAPKRIENTRRISAVEGTKLDLDLRLNKPVVSATLVAHDAGKTAIPLQIAEGKAVAALPAFTLQKSQVYDLKLVDREGRTNPLATPIVIDVLPNRPPELHVTSPRGDLRPSAVEEITFTGNLLGEFGVASYGLAYTLAGGETKFVELGQAVPALEKRAFNYTLRLEDLGVRSDQLLSWYVWADDTGPDNQRRRTAGDLFFAEIRRFDETFRENQGMESPESPAGEAGGQSQKLAELQKQIIGATWKLQRSVNEAKYVDDAQVVQNSQEQALNQATQAQAQAQDPRAQALWVAATNEMDAAGRHLQEAVRTPKTLSVALADEQAAYQSLLRLQPLVTQVSRRRGRGGQGGGSDQRQLAQLDLTQEKNRYETQKQATAAQTPERTAQLQVMNRLQELARRQQDVNDRLKEMQTALQEAKTASEREDLRRQLKRLQEEQQQVVADADELRQRMDELQNQANLSEQRRQLEQTRGEAQSAADAAGQGQVSEALAAGTRAQRQFQTMRDQLHQQNSNQFSDELKGIRGAARELAQKEEELSQKLAGSAGAAGAGPKPLSDDGAEAGPAQDLTEQKRRMTDLVNRAKQVSQEAESSEPLLSEKLYDSVRKLAQEDSGTAKEFQQSLLNSGLLTRSLNDRLTDEKATEGTKSIDLTSGLLQKGYRTQATEAEQRTRDEIDHLKEGMEEAANSVIGDDTAALKLAQSELDTVTQQLKAEAQAAGDPAKRSGSAPGQKGEAGSESKAAPGEVAAHDAKASGDHSDAANGDQAAAANESAASGARPSSQRSHAPSLAGDARSPGTPPDDAAGGQEQAGTEANNRTGGGTPLAGAAGGRTARGPVGPITGEGYAQWSDRMRTVEEIVDAPDLRNAVATAREHARLLRQDYARSGKRPDWEELNLQIVKPLLDVRNQIADELARRGSKESLVPIDRDPVPNRYAESVRKYYEELGKDK